MSFIEIRNLRKVYRIGSEKVVALDNINLDIQRGEVLCILGTSGSGKSTLLNMLAGLEKPTRGSVKIGAVDVCTLSEKRLALFRQKNVGFIFQSYNLMPALTAIENVAMPLMFRGMGKARRNRAALKMLTGVGLKNRARHKPTQMSGGQQQRVGIARAFVAKPKIVFADEPTGNLDTKTTYDVMNLMVRMSRENNQTFILVTHDSEIAVFADRVIHIIDGKIEKDVTVADEQREKLAQVLEEIERDKALQAELEAQQAEEKKARRKENQKSKKRRGRKQPKTAAPGENPPETPPPEGGEAPPTDESPPKDAKPRRGLWQFGRKNNKKQGEMADETVHK